MELSRVLSKAYNFAFPFADFLYILQQEEYDASRYLAWLPRFFFRRGFGQAHLVKTHRARILYGGSLLIFLCALSVLVLLLDGLALIGAVLLLSLAIPFLVLLGALALAPLFYLLKKRLWERARQRIKKQQTLTVVMIAGSYGKTSTRELLRNILEHTFRLQTTSGNINTTTGIATFICKDLRPETTLLLLETDAYKEGEIRDTARIAPPDIAVVLNVGGQHGVRFKSKARLARTLGELFEEAKPDATLFASRKTIEALPSKRDIREVDEQASGSYDGTPLDTSTLSSTNKTNLAYALAVAKALSIPSRFVLDAVASFTPPDRRQKETIKHGYDAIDDSYNISLETATEGIRHARAVANRKGKKLLIVAAGITELGPEELDGNVVLGRQIKEAADKTALLGSMFASDIKKGLGNAPYDEFSSFEEFLSRAHELYPPNDWLVLFQPALPPLYY